MTYPARRTALSANVARTSSSRVSSSRFSQSAVAAARLSASRRRPPRRRRRPASGSRPPRPHPRALAGVRLRRRLVLRVVASIVLALFGFGDVRGIAALLSNFGGALREPIGGERERGEQRDGVRLGDGGGEFVRVRERRASNHDAVRGEIVGGDELVHHRGETTDGKRCGFPRRGVAVRLIRRVLVAARLLLISVDTLLHHHHLLLLLFLHHHHHLFHLLLLHGFAESSSVRGSARQADDVDVDRRPSHGRVDEERVRPSVGVLLGTPLGTLRDRRRRRGEAHQRHLERLRDGGDRFDLRRGRRVVHRHDESPRVVRASRPPPRRSASAATRVTVAASSRAWTRVRDSSRGLHGTGFPSHAARMTLRNPSRNSPHPYKTPRATTYVSSIPGRAARRTRRSASAEAFPMPGTSKRRGSSSSVRTPSGWVGVVEAHALGDETTTSALGRRSSRAARSRSATVGLTSA